MKIINQRRNRNKKYIENKLVSINKQVNLRKIVCNNAYIPFLRVCFDIIYCPLSPPKIKME